MQHLFIVLFVTLLVVLVLYVVVVNVVSEQFNLFKVKEKHHSNTHTHTLACTHKESYTHTLAPYRALPPTPTKSYSNPSTRQCRWEPMVLVQPCAEVAGYPNSNEHRRSNRVWCRLAFGFAAGRGGGADREEAEARGISSTGASCWGCITSKGVG